MGNIYQKIFEGINTKSRAFDWATQHMTITMFKTDADIERFLSELLRAPNELTIEDTGALRLAADLIEAWHKANGQPLAYISGEVEARFTTDFDTLRRDFLEVYNERAHAAS